MTSSGVSPTEEPVTHMAEIDDDGGIVVECVEAFTPEQRRCAREMTWAEMEQSLKAQHDERWLFDRKTTGPRPEAPVSESDDIPDNVRRLRP